MMRDQRPGLPLTPQAIVGTAIIAYGLLLTADNFGWIRAGNIFSFWPWAIVVLGATMLSRATDGSSRFSATLVLGLGILLVAGRALGVPIHFSLIWPLVLVA